MKAHFLLSPDPLHFTSGTSVTALCDVSVPNPDLIWETVVGDNEEFKSANTLQLCSTCLKRVFAELAKPETARLYLYAVATRKEAKEAPYCL